MFPPAIEAPNPLDCVFTLVLLSWSMKSLLLSGYLADGMELESFGKIALIKFNFAETFGAWMFGVVIPVEVEDVEVEGI